MGLLDEITARVQQMDESDRAELEKAAMAGTADMVLVPNPGPQTDAYFSAADELYFGGAAGGGKSVLLLMLALQEHRVSRLFRRQFTDIDGSGGLAQSMGKLIATGMRGYNSQKHVWQLPHEVTNGVDRSIEFGAFTNQVEAERYQGRAADFLGFDEAVQFQWPLIQFLSAWNRPGAGVPMDQRCRVVLASNPPVTPEGLWIFDRYAAWLDPEHPNPAAPGRLRWYATIEGHEVEVQPDEQIEVRDALGRPIVIRPKSRTFIPASLSDNPDLVDAGYAEQLANLPPHLRAALLEGKFNTTLEDAERQIIPTQWILKAQERYELRKTDLQNKAMTALGVDVADGGRDRMVCVPLHQATFGAPVVKAGSDVSTTTAKAAFILTVLRDDAQINIDCGGGYGSGVSDMLESNQMNVKRIKGAQKPTRSCPRTGRTYANLRTQMIYEFRDSLDPENGDNIALPPGREVVLELTAFREMPREDARNVIRVEPNDVIVERIGRSPDIAWGFFFAWAAPNLTAKENRQAYVSSRRRTGHVSTMRDSGLNKLAGRRRANNSLVRRK